ncbi:Major Facilitator Superfamily protein [Micromonospora chaiyaphumensis]|uniref:Major Facilitator Superfamily protein n=1 Tax=Micromonospora chaiyaphumensis TaxID=307119 RepID=A0A1C4W447_9ACTN|nr:Major Facilitator Superfamily protein [Micromonospora chaiyaphumensis]
MVNAYIADVTEPESRARAYGLIGAAFGLGFVAGPTIGGLLGAVDVRLPFFAAAALSFANVAYGWFVLPESRPGDRTTPLTLRLANPVGSLAAVLRRPVLGRLAYARFCADVARMTHQSIWAFFLTYQFAWSTAHIGVVMAAGALAGAVFQARAVGPVVRLLGGKPAAVAGGLLGAASLVGTAFGSVPWMLYLLQMVGVLGAVGGAAAQSWISRSVRPDEQGPMQGRADRNRCRCGDRGAACGRRGVRVVAGVRITGFGLRRCGRFQGRVGAPAGRNARCPDSTAQINRRGQCARLGLHRISRRAPGRPQSMATRRTLLGSSGCPLDSEARYRA